ncbi:DoxX-like family protein [Brucella anthropi]|uniref:DoxX-like family protein n=1 Tax=Brucella anthropi TaxID=529 RepID=UPI001F291AC1|nr:DoxX-like family protein [Brucella anthropi]
MRAVAVLGGHNVPAWLANFTVYGGAFEDIGLGLAILWRSATRMAAVGIIALSACYLLGVWWSCQICGLILLGRWSKWFQLLFWQLSLR